MFPTLFNLGPIAFHSYGLMVSLGFLCAIILGIYMGKRLNITAENVMDISLFILLGALVGARFFYALFYWNELKSPLDIFMIWNGGLVFYGGLLFGTLAIILSCKAYKIPLLDFLDITAPATALGYAIGRIGCFLNGCCYGEICSLPWGVNFPGIEGLRHPTQLYSSLAGLIMLGILVYMFYKRKFPGQIFASGIILYSSYRYVLEYFRANPKFLFNLSSAQWGSIALLIFGFILYGIFNKTFRQKQAS